MGGVAGSAFRAFLPLHRGPGVSIWETGPARAQEGGGVLTAWGGKGAFWAGSGAQTPLEMAGES